jgi:hypothetical protein
MATKLRVTKAALVTKKGKVDEAPNASYAHADIKKLDGKKSTHKAKHEFVLSDGEVVGRKKAAKVAEAAGEVKKGIKKLHSHQLRAGLGIKRVKEPK